MFSRHSCAIYYKKDVKDRNRGKSSSFTLSLYFFTDDYFCLLCHVIISRSNKQQRHRSHAYLPIFIFFCFFISCILLQDIYYIIMLFLCVSVFLESILFFFIHSLIQCSWCIYYLYKNTVGLLYSKPSQAEGRQLLKVRE